MINQIQKIWIRGTNIDQEIVEKALANNSFLHLDLDFTASCDLNCFYCDRTPDRFFLNKRKKITFEERKEIIRQAKLLGVKTVEVPGAGEPLNDEYFWETIDYLNELEIIPVIFTSGYCLDAPSIDRLFHNHISIFLKYNHPDPMVQDKFVNLPGYGEKVNKVFQLLQDIGFNKEIPTRLAIDMVLIPQYYELEIVKSIFRYCRKNNIHFYASPLIPEGNADDNEKLMSRNELNKLIEEFRLIDEIEFGLRYEAVRPILGGYRCNQVNIGMHVNLYGEVYDCNGLGRFLGHIRQNTLEEIWNSRYARFIRLNAQNGYCLPRERVFNGTKDKGMERKVRDYLTWRLLYGPDEVVEKGLQYIEYKL